MYLRLFLTFFKVSIFTLGGGLAMIPLIQREVVEKKKWIGKEEFLDVIAISNSLPGSIAVNIATPIGYKLSGRLGALFAAMGAVLPPFTVIIMVASVVLSIRDYPVMEAMFKGIRPCVVALIATAVLNLSRAAAINRRTVVIPAAIILAVILLRIHPVYVVLLAVLVSIVRLWYRKRSDRDDLSEIGS